MLADKRTIATSLFLRLGLAFVFVFVGVDALREPVAWAGYLPPLLVSRLPQKLALEGFAVFQLVMAAALLWRRTAAYAAIIALATLIGIVATNWAGLLTVFRDIGLAFMAAALVVLDWEQRLKLKP